MVIGFAAGIVVLLAGNSLSNLSADEREPLKVVFTRGHAVKSQIGDPAYKENFDDRIDRAFAEDNVTYEPYPRHEGAYVGPVEKTLLSTYLDADIYYGAIHGEESMFGFATNSSTTVLPTG